MTYLEVLRIKYGIKRIAILNHLEREETRLRTILTGEYPYEWIGPFAIAEFKSQLSSILENIDKL